MVKVSKLNLDRARTTYYLGSSFSFLFLLIYVVSGYVTHHPLISFTQLYKIYWLLKRREHSKVHLAFLIPKLERNEIVHDITNTNINFNKIPRLINLAGKGSIK